MHLLFCQELVTALKSIFGSLTRINLFRATVSTHRGFPVCRYCGQLMSISALPKSRPLPKGLLWCFGYPWATPMTLTLRDLSVCLSAYTIKTYILRCPFIASRNAKYLSKQFHYHVNIRCQYLYNYFNQKCFLFLSGLCIKKTV